MRSARDGRGEGIAQAEDCPQQLHSERFGVFYEVKDRNRAKTEVERVNTLKREEKNKRRGEEEKKRAYRFSLPRVLARQMFNNYTIILP